MEVRFDSFSRKRIKAKAIALLRPQPVRVIVKPAVILFSVFQILKHVKVEVFLFVFLVLFALIVFVPFVLYFIPLIKLPVKGIEGRKAARMFP